MIHVKTVFKLLGMLETFWENLCFFKSSTLTSEKSVTSHVLICSVYRYHFTRFWRWFEMFPHYDLFYVFKCLSLFKGNKIITQKVLKIFWKQMENLDFTILFYKSIFFNCYIYTRYKLYNPRDTKSIFISNYCSFQHLCSDPQITIFLRFEQYCYLQNIIISDATSEF